MALSNEFIAFFKELEQNNYREWFHENKKRFETYVKVPFEQLTQDVIDRMNKIDPGIAVTPKECVFRIFRDVRFSKDKSPYKTHMASVVSRGGRKDMSYPGIYFQVTGHAVMVAGGIWQPDKDRLVRIREKIAEDPKAFRKIVDAKKFKDTFGELNGERNKIIPKEFREAGEIVPEIYNKSFHYWKELPGKKYITAKDLDKIIVDHYKIADKFNAWLVETA